MPHAAHRSDAARGLACLHDARVVHKDIAARNILVGDRAAVGDHLYGYEEVEIVKLGPLRTKEPLLYAHPRGSVVRVIPAGAPRLWVEAGMRAPRDHPWAAGSVVTASGVGGRAFTRDTYRRPTRAQLEAGEGGAAPEFFGTELTQTLAFGADAVATFAKGHQPADVHVGRATDSGWAVSSSDLVEPIPGTLLRLLGRPAEVRTVLASDDVTSATTALLACKEAVRAHLVAHLGRDVHPTSLRLVQLRPERWVVAEATTLTAQEFIDHLAATRFAIACTTQDGTSVAQRVSLGVSRR